VNWPTKTKRDLQILDTGHSNQTRFTETVTETGTETETEKET
jgi:hypothetical protein